MKIKLENRTLTYIPITNHDAFLLGRISVRLPHTLTMIDEQVTGLELNIDELVTLLAWRGVK